MSLPQPGHLGYTQADYAHWEGSWELIHGVAFAKAPAPGIAHQRHSRQLGVRLVQALDEARRRSGGNCEAFFALTDVYLPPDSVVQPDLLVVCDPSKISERGIEGAPDLVVEILSPRTASQDLTTKRWLYEASGVKEYLVVDPAQDLAILYVLDPEERYQEMLYLAKLGQLPLLGGTLNLAFGGE